MSNIVQIPNYNANLALMLSQFQNSPKLRAILESADISANDLETALFEIRDQFWIDSAIGVQLDVIGRILQVPRNGASDSVYRAEIKSRAGLFFSGEPESIISAFKVIYEATSVLYRPAYPTVPAAYYIFADAILSQLELDNISPSGVQGMQLNPIVDAVYNFLSDAVDNVICAVFLATFYLFVLENGDFVITESGDILFFI